MRLGIVASQWKRTPSAHHASVVSGKPIRATGDLHALSMYGVNGERFGEMVGERYTARTRKRRAVIDEATGEAFFPVIMVRPSAHEGPLDVYNLEVEGDNSYHAGGVAVHNCWCAPGESNTCGKRFGWQLGELPRGYDHKYIYSTLGYNFKPTDMQAAIGVAQLDRLRDFIERRRQNFERLYHALAPFQDGLILPTLDPRADPSWFGFPITVRAGVSRNELVQRLETANIETRQVFGGNILKQPGYRDIPRRIHGTLAETDRIMRDTFFVGVYPGLSDGMLEHVVATVRSFFR
ncbi:MAG: DegT/DnrJ/EryC1/StrS family aminotransferase [Candidatus Rokubacteria bacterium]|nr:DegT/DnrJ/EryC1/StrS family aminotransferase [Candidatus Rokubacteria bacterium]